jgi:HAMP domain-containing protein
MLIPSITTLALGALVLVLLGVLDWYVWGATLRREEPLSPERRRSSSEQTASWKEVA